MKRSVAELIVSLQLLTGLFVPLAVLVGCSTESPKGGPAATSQNGGANRDGFKLEAPSMRTDIKPGERKEVKLSIDRDGNFNEAVDLEFKAPDGVTVNAFKTRFEPNDKEIKLTIEAAPDAKRGEASIEVVGKPQTGAPTSITIPIEIESA